MSLVNRQELIDALSETEGFSERTFQMGASKPEFTRDKDGNMLFRLGGSNEEFMLSEDAFVKAARICGIPESYVNKFPLEDKHRLNDHLTYWFNKREDDVKLLLARDGITVVSFIKASVDYYSRVELLEIAEDVLAPADKSTLLYDKVHNSLDKGTHFAIISDKQEFMRPGDLVKGGIQIQDHVLGELPLTITAYVWRQVCGNGMLSQEAVAKWSRRGDIANLKDWIRQAVEDSHNAIEAEFARVKKLQEVPIENHGSDVLKAIFSEYRISARMREVITDNIVNAGAETMYDVFNAITEAANHEDFADNPAMIRNLQSIAGNVAVHSNFCPSCYSILHD